MEATMYVHKMFCKLLCTICRLLQDGIYFTYIPNANQEYNVHFQRFYYIYLVEWLMKAKHVLSEFSSLQLSQNIQIKLDTFTK